MENQTKGDSAADSPKPGNYRQSQSMEDEDGLPPLSEADTAFTSCLSHSERFHPGIFLAGCETIRGHYLPV